MRTLVIIPCRYNSSRFPGKSLAKFKGIPLVQRVYEQVKKSSVVDHVIIATDDKRIYDFAKEINADCSYSLKKYENGSERCFDVIKENYDEYDFFINVQGDIAVFNPKEIDELCLIFKKEKPQIITIANKIINEAFVLHSKGKFLEAARYYQSFINKGFKDLKDINEKKLIDLYQTKLWKFKKKAIFYSKNSR